MNFEISNYETAQFDPTIVSGNTVTEGEGYKFIEGLFPTEKLEKVAKEAQGLFEGAVYSRWIINRDADMADMKSRYRFIRIFDPSPRGEEPIVNAPAPQTVELLSGISEQIGQKLLLAQFNLYEPHSFIRPHFDPTEPGLKVTSYIIGVDGKGVFRIHDNQFTGSIYDEVEAQFDVGQGDAAVLLPLESNNNSTRAHSATNDHEEPRIILLASFAT